MTPGTVHGNAKVRPDGKVQLQAVVDEDIYRRIFDWSREWGMSMGEAIEHLVDEVTAR